MSEKILEVSKGLYGCLTIEKEVNRLYETATKKLPCPQLSAITTAIAYGNQKHEAVIQELCKPLVHISLSPDDLSNEFKRNMCEITNIREALAMENNLENDDIISLLKTLTYVEDYLTNLYANLVESKLIEDYSIAVSDVTNLTSQNTKYIIQTLKQDNINHRDMLIESLYFYDKSLQRNKDTTPKVRYQNPNAWVHP